METIIGVTRADLVKGVKEVKEVNVYSPNNGGDTTLILTHKCDKSGYTVTSVDIPFNKFVSCLNGKFNKKYGGVINDTDAVVNFFLKKFKEYSY